MVVNFLVAFGGLDFDLKEEDVIQLKAVRKIIKLKTVMACSVFRLYPQHRVSPCL